MRGDTGEKKNINNILTLLLVVFIFPSFLAGCFLFGKGGLDIIAYIRRYNQRAYNYYKEGDFETAESELKKALELSPENPDSHYIRGLISYKQKDLEGARDSFARSVNISPDEARYRTNLAVVYDDMGDHETALKHHLLAIKKNSSLAEAHNNIAECYYYLAKYKLAWKHLKKAESLNYPVKGEFVKSVLQALKKKK